MNPVPIINPEIVKTMCCSYGEQFVIDMLHDAWHYQKPSTNPNPASAICPSCGRTVYVNWTEETYWWEERKESKDE